MKKLLDIQKNLKANKSQYNSFGKYNYRSCEDILEAVKPLLVANNCILTLSDEMIMLGDRFYVKATAKLKDLETGETEITTAYAREEADKKGMDGSQITGASSSYARKYALNGLFAIDDAKDSDSTNKGEETKNTKPKDDSKKVDSKEVALVKKMIVQTGTDMKKVLQAYKVAKLEDLTPIQLEQVKHAMENR